MICQELLEFEQYDKVFNITLDNTSNNNVAVEYLHGCLLLPINSASNFLTLGVYHVINLIMQLAFDNKRLFPKLEVFVFFLTFAK